MADVVTALDPRPFAAGSSLYPVDQWERAEITNADGVWHGFRLLADPLQIVRAALVTPSPAYLATLATAQTAADARRAADANAAADVGALKARAATAAAGGAALTPVENARLLVALGAR